MKKSWGRQENPKLWLKEHPKEVQAEQALRTSGRYQQKCIVCQNKDEEDLYIVFNILYRVIVGENFSKSFQVEQFESELDPIQEEKKDLNTQPIKQGQGTADEKFAKFKEMISRQILIEVIESSQFYQIFKELFQQKYEEIKTQQCSHSPLAEYFIESFELPEQQEKGSLKKEKTLDNVTRLDSVYNSIQKLKADVESCHTDIDSISNHITERLFKKQDISSKTNEEVDEESKNYSIENEIGSLVETQNAVESSDKTKSGKENNGSSRDGRNNSSSGSGSNGNGGNTTGNGNSDRSTGESSSHNNNGQNDSSSGQNNTDRSRSKSEQKESKNDQFKSKLPKKATDILKQWFLNNVSNPYPSHEAKETLSKVTGLSRKQIQNWFTNSRKRFLEPLKRDLEDKHNSRENSQERKNKIPPFIPSEYSQLSPRNKTNAIGNLSPKTDKKSESNQKDIMQDESSAFKQPPQKEQQGSMVQETQPQNPQNMQTIQNHHPHQPVFIQPVQYGFPMIQQQFPSPPTILVNPYNMPQTPYIYASQPNGQLQQQPATTIQNNNNTPSTNTSVNPSGQQVNGLNQQQQQQYAQIPQSGAFMLQQHNGISYLVPVQGNYVDNRNLLQQNLSTSFNTFNNNVYNNISNMGFTQQNGYVPVNAQQDKRPVIVQPEVPQQMGVMGGVYLAPNQQPVPFQQQQHPSQQQQQQQQQEQELQQVREIQKQKSPTRPSQTAFKGVDAGEHPKPQLEEQGIRKLVRTQDSMPEPINMLKRTENEQNKGGVNLGQGNNNIQQ